MVEILNYNISDVRIGDEINIEEQPKYYDINKRHRP